MLCEFMVHILLPSKPGTTEIVVRDFRGLIQRVNGAFHKLWKIWNSRTIKTPPAKISIYKPAVVTILFMELEPGTKLRNK